MVEEHLRTVFYQNPEVKERRENVEKDVTEGRISATMAVSNLIAAFEGKETEDLLR